MFSRRTTLSLLFFFALGLVAWVGGCSPAPPVWGEKKPHILVTVPPLYSFAKSVAGEHGEVKCLCVTEGPHHYKYSTTDVRLLRGATCFFNIGLNLDDKFGDDLAQAAGKEDLRIKLGDKLPANLKHPFAHENTTTDPHVWNGTPQAIALVEQIRDELKKADEAHKDDYDKNAAAYTEDLKKKVHDYGITLLKDKKNRKIVSFHESLGYFAREFDIEIVGVLEDIPGNESDISKIRELVNKCKEHNVHVIAVEPQYPQNTGAATLRDQLEKVGYKDIQLVEINPLETAAEKDLTAELYINTMRKNLDNLAKNLK